MKSFKSVVVAGVVTAALVGCSGSKAEENEPTKAGSSQASSSAPSDGATEEAAEEAEADPCSGEDADDDVEVSFGEIAAASDEWSAVLGRQWRHYYPMTITNVSGSTCLFGIGADVLADDKSAQHEEIYIPLEPGQSYSLQVFELDAAVDFTADSEAAGPTTPLAPQVVGTTKRLAAPDYYDADFAFGDIEGSGAEAVLPLTVDYTGVAAGEPRRASSSNEDFMVVNGLDKQGDVVASVWVTIDDLFAEGETRLIEVPIGGGTSSGISYNHHPETDFRKAVSFEVVDFSPSATHRK